MRQAGAFPPASNCENTKLLLVRYEAAIGRFSDEAGAANIACNVGFVAKIPLPPHLKTYIFEKYKGGKYYVYEQNRNV